MNQWTHAKYLPKCIEKKERQIKILTHIFTYIVCRLTLCATQDNEGNKSEKQ